jgi:hypothetical protein
LAVAAAAGGVGELWGRIGRALARQRLQTPRKHKDHLGSLIEVANDLDSVVRRNNGKSKDCAIDLRARRQVVELQRKPCPMAPRDS